MAFSVKGSFAGRDFALKVNSDSEADARKHVLSMHPYDLSQHCEGITPDDRARFANTFHAGTTFVNVPKVQELPVILEVVEV